MNPTLALFLPIAAPLAAALLAAVVPWRPAATAGVLAAAATVAGAVALAVELGSVSQVDVGLLRADALTAYLLIAVGAVATVACWASVHQLAQDTAAGATPAATRRYLGAAGASAAPSPVHRLLARITRTTAP